MHKKMIALFAALMMAFAVTGCRQTQSESKLPDVTLTEEQKVASLTEIAEKLEEQLRVSDASAEAEFVVADDGTCKIVSRTTVNETVSEQDIFTAASIDEAFQSYYEAGFVTQYGDVQGFPETAKEAASEPSASIPTPEEIMANTELSGEDATIAGFPGEGRVDTSSSDISDETPVSESVSDMNTESESSNE